MRGATAPRLLLELACVRAILPGSDESMAGLTQRLETLEQRAAGAAFAAPAHVSTVGNGPVATSPVATGPAVARAALAKPAEPVEAPPAPVPAAPVTSAAVPPWEDEAEAPQANPPQPAPASEPVAAPADDWADAEPVPAAEPAYAPAADSGGVTAASIRRQWDRIMMAVKDKKRTTAALLQDATIADASDKEVVLAFKHAFHAENLQKEPAYGIVVGVFNEVLGGSWKIRCEVGEAGSLPKAVTGAAPSPAPSRTAPAGSQAGQSASARPQGQPSRQAPPPAAESYEEPPAEDYDEPSPDDPVAPGGFGTSEEQAVKLLTTAFSAKQIA
jgi:DNA polymerase-3 subunit gamma/tau